METLTPAKYKSSNNQSRESSRARKIANCYNFDKTSTAHIKRLATARTKNGRGGGGGGGVVVAIKVQIQQPPIKKHRKTTTSSDETALFELVKQPVSSAERAPRKKKRLLTREKLLTVKNDKLRRQIAPIRNWSSLEIGKPYLFKRVVAIEAKRKWNADFTNNWGLGHYAELVCAEEPLINVWLTPTMVKESENYYLETGDLYIVPLGKRVSQNNRREYHAFTIVPGNELVF